LALLGTVAPAAAGGGVRFTDVTEAAGIDFVHFNGATGTKYACELIGPGGAVLDFDGDGDLDLYLVSGALLPGAESATPPVNALYENVTNETAGVDPASPSLRFRRVPGAAGAADGFYGMGAAVGDIDNDGDPDLYVTNFGRNSLYRNDGGRFTDVTDAAGVGDVRWSTSAAFFDADNDGRLDLYVCNYFRYRIEDHGWYGKREPGYRTNGGPASFDPDVDVFYRNRGDGTFEDATAAAGFALPAAFALGVLASDVDDDGDADLWVANDTQANRLFLNDGTGHFTEDGALAGCAYDRNGRPQAGMGVDAQDANGDGLVDLFCTNFSQETNTLYLGEGDGFFHDAAWETGLAQPSLDDLGFGTAFVDVENDRDLDLVVVNGHITDNIPLYFDHLTYKQANQLFLNDGAGRFVTADAGVGDLVTRVEASRGLIVADLDDDGDADLVVTDVATSPQVLRNDSSAGNWIRVVLEGTRSNRDGTGAEVLVTADGVPRRFQARSGFGYLTSSDPRVRAGLGDAASADVEVRWPSGAVDRVSDVRAGATVRVREGIGR
jgi:hypothetical protein